MNDIDQEHPTAPEQPRTPRSLPSTKKLLGLAFGIFMVCIYVGMGILLMLNFFGWYNDWAWTRWIVGVVLIIYGFFRGYRQYIDFTRRDDF
jgi:cytochrome c biogenesis protein CcdA